MKLCKDCVGYQPMTHYWDQCNRVLTKPSFIDGTQTTTRVQDARTEGGPCGPAGKLWSQKPPVEPSLWMRFVTIFKREF